MVAISKSISTKIKDKQGDITDDEVCASVCIYIKYIYSTTRTFKHCKASCLPHPPHSFGGRKRRGNEKERKIMEGRKGEEEWEEERRRQ